MRFLISRIRVLATIGLVSTVSAACQESSEVSVRFGVLVDTIGDTVSVITAGPGVWGSPATLVPSLTIGELEGPSEYLFESIAALAVDAAGVLYVLDSGAGEVRAFDPKGRHIRTYGRRGDGPGELLRPSAVAVLSDGRVLVSDRGNRRIQVYDHDGRPDDEWTLPGFLVSTDKALWVDAGDEIIVATDRPSVESLRPKQTLIRLSGAGEILDTIPHPTRRIEPAILEARGRGGSSLGLVPFAPQPEWGLHPSGRMLLARGDRYAIDLISEDGSVLRIGREHEPLPVTQDERRSAEERVVAGMRRVDPTWRWDGPPIPEWKPPFDDLHIGQKGRIWTRLVSPVRREPNPDHDPSDPQSKPTVLVWEYRLFDVFEADGTYLGQVEPPAEFKTFTTVFSGDNVWTVQRDDLGVPRIVRYSIHPPNAS